MADRPILFSAPMVRALLAGVKSQTRRAVKGWPLEWLSPPVSFTPEYVAHPDNKACPYGQPGDRLWVREAWGVADKWLHDCETDPPRCIAYRADLAARNFDPVYDVDTSSWAFGPHMKWRPSIHMPRWASRITLEVTGVRVERLQDISEADAIAEGIHKPLGSQFWHTDPGANILPGDTPVWAYRNLWESINGPDSWAANPWVWVVEFKRVQL